MPAAGPLQCRKEALESHSRGPPLRQSRRRGLHVHRRRRRAPPQRTQTAQAAQRERQRGSTQRRRRWHRVRLRRSIGGNPRLLRPDRTCKPERATRGWGLLPHLQEQGSTASSLPVRLARHRCLSCRLTGTSPCCVSHWHSPMHIIRLLPSKPSHHPECSWGGGEAGAATTLARPAQARARSGLSIRGLQGSSRRIAGTEGCLHTSWRA